MSGREEAIEAARRIDEMAKGSALKAGRSYAEGEAEYVAFIRDHAFLVARALLSVHAEGKEDGVAQPSEGPRGEPLK